MPSVLSVEQKADFLSRGFSRRSFGRLATVMTAGAALPFYNEHALAQLSMVKDMPANAVKINANENPMGPCPEAVDAIYNVIKKGGRYMYEDTYALAEAMGSVEGLKNGYSPKESYIEIFAGSSAPLHQAVLAFCSKDKPFVKADPGYEAGERAAKFIGAKVVNVPLRKGTWDHDVRGMLAAAPDAGLYYICNPNNPTGTLTSRADIEYLVANKPKGSVVMVDEAYIHISKSAVPVTEHGGGRQGCCDFADILEALRHGGSESRRRFCASGLARKDQAFQRRGDAYNRHGGCHRQREEQESRSGAA